MQIYKKHARSDIPLKCRCLDIFHTLVETARGREFCRRSAFINPTVLEDYYPVGPGYGTHTVSYYDYGLVLDKPGERLLYERLFFVTLQQ